MPLRKMVHLCPDETCYHEDGLCCPRAAAAVAETLHMGDLANLNITCPTAMATQRAECLVKPFQSTALCSVPWSTAKTADCRLFT